MDNNKLLADVLRMFDNNDTEGLLKLVSEDFEWNMVGSDTAKGKENIRAMFNEMEGKIQIKDIVRDHTVVEGDTAVCDGHQTVTHEGKTRKQFYCDIYEFENRKLRKMTSYIIDKK